jgi:hypothetical protein
VEARRFETVDRFLPCLAIYLIVTWRTLFVWLVGRIRGCQVSERARLRLDRRVVPPTFTITSPR